MTDTLLTPVDFTLADKHNPSIDSALAAITPDHKRAPIPKPVVRRHEPVCRQTWCGWLGEFAALFARAHDHETARVFQSIANRVKRVATDPEGDKKRHQTSSHARSFKSGPAMKVLPPNLRAGLAQLARLLELIPKDYRSQSWGACARDIALLRERL